MKIETHRSHGFTLIELLVYMGILSLLLMVFADILISAMRLQTESTAVSAIENDSQFIMQRLIYDISRANAITFPVTHGTPTNSLNLTISSENFSYQLNQNSLQLTDSAGSGYLNSSLSQISSINFTKIGNPGGKETVKINLTIKSSGQTTSGQQIKDMQFTVKRR